MIDYKYFFNFKYKKTLLFECTFIFFLFLLIILKQIVLKQKSELIKLIFNIYYNLLIDLIMKILLTM